MINDAFIDELKKILPANEIDSFLVACEKPLKKSISLCTGKIDPATFLEITKPRGRHLTPSPFISNQTDLPPLVGEGWGGGITQHKEKMLEKIGSVSTFYIDRDDLSLALGKTFLYQAGFFYIQELAASLPASQLDLKPGDIVLDMAAAPGGKTTQLAHSLLSSLTREGDHEVVVGLSKGGAGERVSPGLIIANEIAPLRLKTMAHNLNQMGCYNTALTQRNGGMFGKHLPETFDHVLLDAPCSGEGTKFKSDDALTFRRKEEINKITGTQFQLLISAVKTVKVGGTIVYSTCTLNPYENEEIINRILEFFPDTLEVVKTEFVGLNPGVSSPDMHLTFDPTLVSRCRPHHQGTGGFFVAKLRKLISINKHRDTSNSKLQPKNPFSLDLSKSLFKKVGKRLDETYGIKLDPQLHLLAATKEQIYLCSPDLLKLQGLLHFEKVGIPILKIDRDLYRPTHYLGNLLGHEAKKNFITFDDELIQRYSEGNEITLAQAGFSDKSIFPYQIVKRRSYGMSVLKILPNNTIKNKRGK